MNYNNSNNLYDAVFATLEEGICVLELLPGPESTPTDFICLLENPSFARLTGADAGVGKRLAEILPKHLATWHSLCLIAVHTGHCAHGEASETSLDVVAMPLIHAGRRCVALVCRDASSERQALHSERDTCTGRVDRRQSQAEHWRLFETAASSARDFLFIFDAEERFAYANQALLDLWQIPVEQAIGKTMRELAYHEETEAAITANLRQALTTGEPVTACTQYIDAEGNLGYCEYSLVPVRDTCGTVSQVVGTARDVSERVRWEERMREADAAKTRFLATLAHELRNPLAPILSALQLMGRANAPAQSVSRARAIMERQVHHMVRLVDDLLDLARIDTGKLELRQVPMPLVDSIRSALETSLPTIEASGHTVTVGLPAGDVLVLGDSIRLAQVFSNLLNNAAKYTPTGGKIDIVASVEPDAVEVRVSDTGIGIAKKDLTRVFEMLTQLPAEGSAQGGLGIGLALVRKLLALHGATIEAASPGLGLGSTFVVRLPRLLQEVSERPASALPPVVRCRRVLVVDDNIDAAELLAECLQLEGHTTHVVHDGYQALHDVCDFTPDVVFLDLGMPRLDGYVTAHKMRQLPGMQAVTIVALTGLGSAEDCARTRAAGFDAHLTKPVGLAAVRKILTDTCAAPPPVPPAPALARPAAPQWAP